MYVGITGASSFALKHFLSGHKVRLHTKLFSKITISNKLLNDKVKCLHLFQCLEESKNKEVATLVGNFLQDQKIDLSNQTLLPNDLNTVGFFLCRSVTKQWDTLNLSGCNIGATGCDILCNRFLDRESRDIVCVKKVDLSFNQLTFSCLLRLFDLFKTWHTSEVIITDDAILNDVSNTGLFTAIEENVMQHIKLFRVGSFFYANNIEERIICHFLLHTEGIRSIHLIECIWESNFNSVQEWYSVLVKQKLDKIHVIGSHTNNCFFAALASVLPNQDKLVDLFIYDLFMPNGIINGLVDISLSSNNTSGIWLIVSSGNIQGTIKTNSLDNDLSPLEMLNLGVCIRSVDHAQGCQWKSNVQKCMKYSKFVLHTLIEYRACNKYYFCNLQILLAENNTLFASNTTIEDIATMVNITNKKLCMFLYNCNLNTSKCEKFFFETCKVLFVINTHLCEYSIKLFFTTLTLQELFLHGSFDVDTDDLIKFVTNCYSITSSLLVTDGMMIGHNPTAKQIALAFQLEPSITVWKIPNGQVTADVFYQLTSWLTTIPNK